jgi:A/G-specific adenine glycosylase
MQCRWNDALLTWFGQNRRSMPWRTRPTPYRVWVSEIMLQQTQVQTVIPYFTRFMKRFPSVRKLAEADLQEVLKVWEGLGYYSRARNLHRAAGYVGKECRGRLPRSVPELQRLPGIGSYTAAAIASICFDVPVPAVDGNVIRVATRLWGITSNPRSTETRKRITRRLASCISEKNAGDFNQAMMELGALVCRPHQPECPACPLRTACVALKSSRTHELPMRPQHARVPHCEVGVGIVIRKGQVLIARRKAEGMLGGLWEFPGGKQRSGEDLKRTVRRKMKEETAIRVRVGEQLCVVNHAYSHFRITLHAFLCAWVSGQAKPLQSDAVYWCPTELLGDYPFPTTGRKVIAALHRQQSSAHRGRSGK